MRRIANAVIVSKRSAGSNPASSAIIFIHFKSAFFVETGWSRFLLNEASPSVNSVRARKNKIAETESAFQTASFGISPPFRWFFLKYIEQRLCQTYTKVEENLRKSGI